MRAKREPVKSESAGTSSSGAEESGRRGSRIEEWTWMVDEDPAYYLNESGTTKSGRGE